jgi:hypothetical protein
MQARHAATRRSIGCAFSLRRNEKAQRKSRRNTFFIDKPAVSAARPCPNPIGLYIGSPAGHRVVELGRRCATAAETAAGGRWRDAFSPRPPTGALYEKAREETHSSMNARRVRYGDGRAVEPPHVEKHEFDEGAVDVLGGFLGHGSELQHQLFGGADLFFGAVHP